MQTERVTFLTSPQHKAALDAYAAAHGQSVGHFVREATSRCMSEPRDEDEEALQMLLAELSEAVPRIRASLERSISKVEKTRSEVDTMLREAGVRR